MQIYPIYRLCITETQIIEAVYTDVVCYAINMKTEIYQHTINRDAEYRNIEGSIVYWQYTPQSTTAMRQAINKSGSLTDLKVAKVGWGI